MDGDLAQLKRLSTISLPAQPAEIDFRNISAQSGRPGTKLFDEIYAVYEHGFPHGARTKLFFSQMVKLNERPSVQDLWGPAQYEVAYAVKNKKPVAMAAYTILAAPSGGWPDSKYPAAVVIDYRSVLPEARSGGIASKFEQRALDRARHLVNVSSDTEILVCNEMAMPLRMPFGAAWEDLRIVGIHPFDRVNTWNNKPEKPGLLRVVPNLEVPFYIEPRSKDGEPACDYYSFNVKMSGGAGATVGTKTIIDIMTRQAALRRMYGDDPRQEDQRFDVMLHQMERLPILQTVRDADIIAPFRQYADSLLAEYPDRHMPPPRELAQRGLGALISERFNVPLPTNM